MSAEQIMQWRAIEDWLRVKQERRRLARTDATQRDVMQRTTTVVVQRPMRIAA